jgi:signal transduction histidine kinase
MIAIPTTTIVLAGVVLALLIAGSAWALATGLAARRDAKRLASEQAREAALAAASPAQVAIVRADGRIDMPAQLADWLGLADSPRYLTDLSTPTEGLEPADAAALGEAVIAAQKAGKPFRLRVAARGSSRMLLAVGARAPEAALAPGGVALWFFDATESEGEIARLVRDSADARSAFEALAGLIEAAPMPMWYRDAELALTMVNSAYVTAVEGEDAADVIRRGLELVERSGYGGPLANAAIARDTGEPQAAAVPATIGGARRMLRIHDVPLPSGGVAGFAVDIEDLEQARGGIKRFGEAQRAMLDRLSAGVAQFGPDRALAFCNGPFRRMFGMRPEWLADRPEFDRVLERMREANRLPETRDFPGWKSERREWFLATDAAEENWNLPGGTHLRVVAQPLPDGGLLLVFEDRTEQVQLASARDTLLRVRTATFDNLFEALGVFAADGRLQTWNQKFRLLWGLEEEYLATHPRVDGLARAAAAKLENPQRAGLIGDLVRSATIDRLQRGGRFVFADGRHYEFAAVPLPDGNALFTMLDITDSRKIERALRDHNEALEAADRVKTAFVANMSYELRTPLTSIQGFTEMLHAGYAGPLSEDGIGYAEAILQSVDRLSALVDDVLELTQNDGVSPTKERIDLELIAGAAAETVRAAAGAKEIELAVEVLGSAGTVTGDPARLRGAIEHLLRHAVGAMPEKGRVLLHVDGDPKRARIIVSDDGPGMSKAEAARAFDRFAQHGPARDGERPLGLGLPLAKQAVEAQGGTITLVSEVGQGTLVTVELAR